MKDYSIGNKIYELRQSEKLSQNKLASLLKISNKAISKWENGDAKPSLDQIIKLSSIFNISLDELIKGTKQKTDKKVYKIVITGGPCSGKSTAMSWLQTEFTKKRLSCFVCSRNCN